MNKDLAINLMYGAAICRLCYYCKSDPSPEAGDIERQGVLLEEALKHAIRCRNGFKVCLQSPTNFQRNGYRNSAIHHGDYVVRLGVRLSLILTLTSVGKSIPSTKRFFVFYLSVAVVVR
jgi:hypothetical protein